MSSHVIVDCAVVLWPRHTVAPLVLRKGGVEEGSVGHEGRGAEHGFGEPRPHVSFISFVI
jgi:hypothetical protein